MNIVIATDGWVKEIRVWSGNRILAVAAVQDYQPSGGSQRRPGFSPQAEAITVRVLSKTAQTRL
jgi:hypothetical protein